MARRERSVYHGCAIAVALGWLAGATSVECQEIRVLLIQPANANALPADVVRLFQRAIREAATDVGFVTRLAEATDLIELTSYEDDLLDEGKEGVTSLWSFSFRPLVHPGDPPAARAAPGNFQFMIQGDTQAEALHKSERQLQRAMTRLLERFRPVVLK
jgi:hypothetical protein